MITLDLTEEHINELYQVVIFNDQPRNRKKALIVYLRAIGKSCHEVAEIVRVNKDTVTNQLKKYALGGLEGLLAENYRHPKSCLEPFIEQLKKLFEQQPPHTVN
jgi:transposase